ncbi:MAG: hypothetical protein HYW16_03785 [Candidatus Rokubacteria bacterium]|nr:hypothetical protein [Candidatus Rokubacteria bacterium]
MKRRMTEPWIPADRYGRLLPAFSVNLLVRDVVEDPDGYVWAVGVPAPTGW